MEYLKKQHQKTYHWLIIFILISVPFSLEAQTHRIAAGLAFASVNSYNTGETGNPGISVQYWHSLDRSGTIHLVPSVSMYNPYKLKTGYMELTNYMFQGDINLHYTFFNQGSVAITAFGGVNATQLFSRYMPIVITGDETLEDRNDRFFGGNLGASLELYMSPRWDFNVHAKYILSEYGQIVIGVQAAYYFIKRRRAYRR
jgi:hypothetical protein